MASPAPIASNLLRSSNPSLAQELGKIPYADVVTVSLAFKNHDLVHPLNGFGHLIPMNEPYNTLGSLYCSSLFSNRAPKDQKLIKVYLGGVHQKNILEKTDKEIINTALKDTGLLLDVRNSPQFCKVQRINQASPQYNLGHQQTKRNIKTSIEKSPGLYLVGNYLDGISVNEAIRSGQQIFQ